MIPPPAQNLVNTIDRLFDALFNPMLAPLNPVSAHLGGMARQIHIGKVGQLMALSEGKVNAHVRLAIAHMEQGDIPAAVHHYQQALVAPEFSEPLPAQRIARENLRAIALARGGPGAVP